MQTEKPTKDQIIELIGQLETMPAEIAALREEANHKAEIADLKESLARIRFDAIQVAGTIVNEDTGKKAYPNAESREAFAAEQLDHDHEYKGLNAELSRLESAAMNAAIKLDAAEKVFSAKKYALSALTEILRGENSEKVIAYDIRNSRLEMAHAWNNELVGILTTTLETLKKSNQELL
ncbi:MAG: hypothetical protein WC455_12375 [Dehalococcoidia bacterium]|jgi:hypothetical protein